MSMNRWLRFRVIAQGLTVVILCGYAFSVREKKMHQQPPLAGIPTEARLGLDPGRTFQNGPKISAQQAAKEKFEFEQRLQQAIHNEEMNESAKHGAGTDAPTGSWKDAWKAGMLKKNAEHAEKKRQAQGDANNKE